MIEWIWPWMLHWRPCPGWCSAWCRRRKARNRRCGHRSSRSGSSSVATGRPAAAAAVAGSLQLALWLIWLLLLLAAARPTWIGEAIELPNSGRDLMLAVDISGSMQIEDMQLGQTPGATRSTAVKQVGADFIARRSGDRLGLILFGSNAYVQSPLSFDTSYGRTLSARGPDRLRRPGYRHRRCHRPCSKTPQGTSGREPRAGSAYRRPGHRQLG